MLRQIVAPVYSRLNILRRPEITPWLITVVMAAGGFGIIVWIDRYLTDIKVMLHLAILLSAAFIFGIILCWIFIKKLFTQLDLALRSWIVAAGITTGMLFFAILSPHIGLRDSKQVYLWLYWPSLSVALVPWFWVRAVKAVADVPQLRFAPFIFDSLKDVIAAIRFSEDEFRGIRWVFENDFYEIADGGVYDFRTFLPKDLKEHSLAKLFKSVISLHNVTEFPESPIHFRVDKEFYGWVFYDYPYWIWPKRKRYLNPHKLMHPWRFRFRRLSDVQRSKSIVKLMPGFRAATIYVTRTTTTSIS